MAAVGERDKDSQDTHSHSPRNSKLGCVRICHNAWLRYYHDLYFAGVMVVTVLILEVSGVI